jgi:phosphate transport system permease protein
MQRDSILSEAREIAHGQRDQGFNPESSSLAPAVRDAETRYSLIGGAVALAVSLLGAWFALRQTAPQFRARSGVEKWLMVLLVAASLIAILTTLGILLSLMFESLRFFKFVSPVDFLFGTGWSPQTAIRADQAGSSGAFGSVPLFWGTIFIGAIIAMIVAVPLGLMSAIYLTQYAHPRLRSWLKPILEILAGVPTVVYGYFAALTIAPRVRDFGLSLGIHSASSESALAAGLVMGIMIIPFISSMADDSIAAVPQAMRDGSLAMGATRSETIRKVLLPAALPGVVGGVLLAVSRAIGETMIVVMAAGLAANLTANPFASVTTVTVQIVQLLTGDQEFDSPKTLAAFALGLALFLITLVLNIIALQVVRRYREQYE